MTGNTFGTLFKVTSFGESHGTAIGCVVDGCPAGMLLTAEDIQPYLDKRKPGQSKYTSQRKEADEVEILAGVFEGKTTGAPIALVIKNTNQRSSDYENLREVFRPGHADFTYHHKYGYRDHRGGGRASARETAVRVAAGAIARIFLKEKLGIDIYGYLEKIGSLNLQFDSRSAISENPFFCPNLSQIDVLEKIINELRKAGDSIGAQVKIIATGLPKGLGEPVFDKLDAILAQALMSINAVKAVAIGDGFAVVEQLGSEHRDEMDSRGFLSNHAGGILGGISTGQDLILTVALKPTSSIIKPGKSINIYGEEVQVVTKGRHDPCVGIRAVPIAEAMTALVLMDYYLISRSLENMG